MTGLPKISIVTPSFNDAKYLEQTICSVVDQGYPNLEYIIIDGGSTDGSIDIIKKYDKHLAYWVSERDGGMYHAISKGFSRSTGYIMGWLNSDDKHQAGSLFSIADIFANNENVHWLQGMPNIIDEENRIVYVQPRPEVGRFFFYAKKHVKSHKYVQQESTFWTRALWEKAGGLLSTDFKYAGDFELWIRFFQHETLYQVPAILASFRLAKSDQHSIEHYDDYLAETLAILNRYPLNRREKSELMRMMRIEKVKKFISRFTGGALPDDISVNSSSLYFDNKSQRFRSR